MKTEIKKFEFKPGLSHEFEIVDIGDLYRDFKDALTTIHRAGFYHIIWFQKGAPTHLVDFNPIEIQPNSLLFLNKDTVQRFDNKTKFEGKAILFTASFFGKTQADVNYLRNSVLFNNLFAVSQIKINQAEKIFADILHSMTEELQKINDNLQADILQNLLHNFLLVAERERRKQHYTEVKKGADLDFVMQFKELLESNFNNKKQVNFYAKALNITEKRLNQATSTIFGATPKKIIDDRVILEVKRILAHTTESIKEIGYSLGFDEPTNFIKYFKKHTYSTPVEFRQKNNLA